MSDLDISLLAAGTTPGLVRSLVQFRLTEWGLLGIAGDVQLVAGELVANAVQSTPDQAIRVRFTREAAGVLLAVWDSSPEMPVARPVVEMTLDDIAPDLRALDPGHLDGGRGLQIVQALSSRCGVAAGQPSGKWVWARLPC
ncbi:ATP-binding protein [Actinomadura macra]|uniref:ATP-binding protein n=1 Tax=Actinomadura macra TaxID=46164 RepID=UPI001471CC1C|nr:ATP-binding protein [Actinomadura macra]